MLSSARGCGRRNVAWGGGEAGTPGSSAIQYASPRTRATAMQTAQVEIRWTNRTTSIGELSPVSRAWRFTWPRTWGCGFASTPGYALSPASQADVRWPWLRLFFKDHQSVLPGDRLKSVATCLNLVRLDLDQPLSPGRNPPRFTAEIVG